MMGHLDDTPLYLILGNMATAFGLTDTAILSAASSHRHAFDGIAPAISKDGLNVCFTAAQGDAQFRGNNTSVAAPTCRRH